MSWQDDGSFLKQYSLCRGPAEKTAPTRGQSNAEVDTEGRSSVESGGGSDNGGDDMGRTGDVEDTAYKILSATANIILPFEMIKKALSMDYGTETAFPEGDNKSDDYNDSGNYNYNEGCD